MRTGPANALYPPGKRRPAPRAILRRAAGGATTAGVTTIDPPGKAAVIGGWILGVLVGGMLAMSAVMKFSGSPELAEGLAHAGWPAAYAPRLGVVELASVVLYFVPPTAVLGAVLITGYMGGAIATHARLGEPFGLQIMFGVVAWLGVWLRDPRLRRLLPLRR